MTTSRQKAVDWKADTVIPESGDPQSTEMIDSGRDVPFTSTHLVNNEVDDHTRKIRYYGDYELLCKIAQCSNGVVYYKARKVNLNRIVALKLIPGSLLASDEEVQRFPSVAATNLDHPGIEPIFEIGQHEVSSAEFVGRFRFWELAKFMI